MTGHIVLLSLALIAVGFAVIVETLLEGRS